MLTRAVVPTGCLYTPKKVLENMPYVEYDPQRCKCGAVLNPFCTVDYNNKYWLCPFCSSRNRFPQQYADNISETNKPVELLKEYSTIEYISNAIEATPNIFLFVVDTCIDKEELDAVKDSL